MSKVCIQCREVVTGNNINPNYRGIAIHYGQDWYCGPVVEIAEDVLESTIAYLEAEAKYQQSVEDYAVEHSVQRTAEQLCQVCLMPLSQHVHECIVPSTRRR